MTAANELRRALDDLDLSVQRYGTESVEAAQAEATHKAARAKRLLKARAEGVRSVSEAEAIAEADDNVADLYMRRLTTSAVADSSKQRILSLRERVGAIRSVLADQREADRQHAMSGGRP